MTDEIACPPQSAKHFAKRPRRGLSAAILAVATLALVVFGLVARNDSWIYTQAGWLDPWSYVGFGYDYDKPGFDATNYKLARLPWILAEFYVRRAFDPLIAQYVLQLGLLLAEGVFLFLAIDRLLGYGPALLGACFLVTITFAHGAGGADYHTTPSGPLYALAFYLMTVAARSDRILSSLSFGLAFGLLLHTNVTYVNFLPPLAIHFIAVRRHARLPVTWRPLGMLSVWTCLGVLIATVSLAFINWMNGREFLFFMRLFSIVAVYVTDSGRQVWWWQPWHSGWFRHQAYAGLLAAGVIIACGLLMLAWLRRLDPAGRHHVVSLCGQYLCVCAIWLFWQSVGQTALEPYYFAYPLWIPLACVISCLAASCRDQPTVRDGIAFGLVLTLAFVAPYSAFEPLSQLLGVLSAAPFDRTMGLYLAIAGTALALLSLPSRIRLYLLATLLGLANALSGDNAVLYRPAACVDRRDAEIAIIEAHNKIASFDPNATRPIFIWRNPDDSDAVSLSVCSPMPARFFGDSLAWSGWSYLDDARPFRPIGEISAERLKSTIPRNPIVVLVTDDNDFVEQMRARFRELNKRFDKVEKMSIRSGNVVISLFVLR